MTKAYLNRNTQWVYKVQVKGHLDKRRVRVMNGLNIAHQANGTTVLTGPVPDQAALFGLLNRLRDLGIPLLSVNCLEFPVEKV